MLATNSLAGSRAGGPYSANDTVDASGGRSKSAASLYTNDASVGGIGGISVVSNPSETVKHGYVGQLYDVVGVTLTASPTSVGEGQTRQISALDMLDDGTFLPVPASNVNWGVLNGPITSVSPSGVATAGLVYQNTNANVQGTHLG
ncbi:MAG: hypothetical protein LC642_01095, partial [Verrucomicrobiaceae bacterium]|nr:hypothetical protein [Verrucomicrobiaceae bacterium]